MDERIFGESAITQPEAPMIRRSLVPFLLLVAWAAFAQPLPVPEDLAATVDPLTGEMTLNWSYDIAPGGYSNDFSTDDLTDWELAEPDWWTVDTDAGVLATVWTPAGSWWWSSAAYLGDTYGSAELSATIRRTDGQLNWAQSLFISGNGPFEPPVWTGFMVQIEVSATPQFNVTRVYEGSTSFVTQGWEDSPFINTGFDAWNTVTVQSSGTGDYTLILNGEAVFNWTDADITMGTVSIGGVGEPGVPQALEWDEVSFSPLDPSRRILANRPVVRDFTPVDLLNEDPRVADAAAPASSTPSDLRDGARTPALDELDDFIEFEVYRNGDLIATTPDPTFSETLPQPDQYIYAVRAIWDEGASEFSSPVEAIWKSLTLLPQSTVVPETGGDVVYDAVVFLTNAQPVMNAQWWVEIVIPGGTLVSYEQISVNLPPFLQQEFTGRTVTVPAFAPPGEYIFRGYLGFPNGPYVDDNFTFTKTGDAVVRPVAGNEIWPH